MKTIIPILLFGTVFLISCQQKNEVKPNIIVFIADDMGWEDSSPYGNEF